MNIYQNLNMLYLQHLQTNHFPNIARDFTRNVAASQNPKIQKGNKLKHSSNVHLYTLLKIKHYDDQAYNLISPVVLLKLGNL